MAEERRRDRIASIALRLAEGRDFESVGLRELAESAGVALGTLYKTFRSKEEIVGAAVEAQTRRLRLQFDRKPATGATPEARIENLFDRLTRALTRRPSYAKTALRATLSRHPDIARAIFQHDSETTRIVIAALRGVRPVDLDVTTCTPGERDVGFLLRHVWFASMVGWAAGMNTRPGVLRHVTAASRLLLAGLEALEGTRFPTTTVDDEGTADGATDGSTEDDGAVGEATASEARADPPVEAAE
ncbi:MAG: TetR/AcrR family transcriptional regulator [Sandaracinaceae bacterium]